MNKIFITPDRGLYIERDTFNTIIAPHITSWVSKEVLPKNTGLDLQPRVLKHYKSLDRGSLHIGLARNRRRFFNKNTSEVLFNDVKQFNKDITIDKKLLTEYQHCVVNTIINVLHNDGLNYGEALLQMNTGLGKTRVACFTMFKIGLKTAVIVPTKHIANQWYEELTTLYPSHSIEISMYTNKHGDTPIGDVVIMIINTACKKDPTFFSQFGLVVFDEVHELTSTSHKNVLWGASSCRYMLGMTATPEYSGNGLLPYIEAHLGKVIYAEKIEGFSVGVKTFDVSVRVIRYNADNPEITEPILSKTGIINTMGTLGKIIKDSNRTRVLIENIINLYKQGHNILVFAEHREHVDDLCHELTSNTDIHKEDIINETATKVLKGGATSDMINAAKKCRIILTTYSYSRRGIDYHHLDALVLATPRKSGLIQIIGRILRYSGDASKPRVIIDLIDNQSVFRSQFTERKKVYTEKNYEIFT